MKHVSDEKIKQRNDKVEKVVPAKKKEKSPIVPMTGGGGQDRPK